MDDAAREKASRLLDLASGGTKIPVWLDCDTGSFSHSIPDLMFLFWVMSVDSMIIRCLTSDIS